MPIPTDGVRLDQFAVGPNHMPETYVTFGPMLCELRISTAAEWSDSEHAENPVALAYVPGLGWIAAVPIQCLN